VAGRPKLVIEGALTVGQLIAFNMLAGRVAQPVMRLAQLWTDFSRPGFRCSAWATF
jgi:subfamily B ATP-binding cassette protein HlyB/CyaB